MNLPVQAQPVMRMAEYRIRNNENGIEPNFCLEAHVNSRGQVCVSTGFGDVCVALGRSLPEGTSVQACVDLCWKGWGPFKIPVGACASINFSGQQIGKACVGLC
ncbi:MAG TPA: hypothetical protein VHY08_01965 [Bacillota bacterium]|nr:hypothetical protein [Bacillota bacterium]